MSEEELIETLRTFEKNRVEQLEEPAKNLFYAIMKIADERDRLNNIIKRFEEDLREVYLTFGEFSEEYTEKKIRELKGSDKE